MDSSLKSMIAIHQCTPKCTGTQIKSYENKSTFFVHLRSDCGPSLTSLEQKKVLNAYVLGHFESFPLSIIKFMQKLITSSFSQFSPPNVFRSRLVMFKLNFRARTSLGSPLNAFCNRLWCSSVSSGNSVSSAVSISGKIKSFNCKQLSTFRLNSSTLMSLFSSSLRREHCLMASISCWRLSTYDAWFCTLKIIMQIQR